MDSLSETGRIRYIDILFISPWRDTLSGSLCRYDDSIRRKRYSIYRRVGGCNRRSPFERVTAFRPRCPVSPSRVRTSALAGRLTSLRDAFVLGRATGPPAWNRRISFAKFRVADRRSASLSFSCDRLACVVRLASWSPRAIEAKNRTRPAPSAIPRAAAASSTRYRRRNVRPPLADDCESLHSSGPPPSRGEWRWSRGSTTGE